ncbi:MAG: lipid-A-disaccharide synthase [Bacteroidaceae bacterium]|nr:lipid-A-disaccharide synthase [Bacteroidaceae bacterium]
MRYYLIAGEASGDLHASRLMAALINEDPQAEFRFFGGDKMLAVGGTLIRHYRSLAYMGFIPVILHARTIIRGLAQCKQDISLWKPDVVILIDYPGFNMKIARYVHSHKICPVFYYIAPKLWAWKEWRIKAIKRDVDALYSILPFEVDFFEKKHGYPINYVGNPTVDEVAPVYAAVADRKADGRNTTSVIAILPGSRRHEISDNLRLMLKATMPFSARCHIVISKAPNIDDKTYSSIIAEAGFRVRSLPSDVPEPTTYTSPKTTNNIAPESGTVFLTTDTFTLLSRATAALVVSGTAVLETALFRVPQVVCYHSKGGVFASLFRRLFIRIPYVSLVNLIANREIVPELLGEQMTAANCRSHLVTILPGGNARSEQLSGYEEVAAAIGLPGAPGRAAKLMVEKLQSGRRAT